MVIRLLADIVGTSVQWISEHSGNDRTVWYKKVLRMQIVACPRKASSREALGRVTMLEEGE